MDVSSKNPAGGVDPARCAGWARRQGRVSLGYFSLHEQREVTRSCEAGAKALLSIFRFHAWPLAWPFDYRVGTDVQGKPEQGREQDQRLSLPFGARATFLCSCKETWPKESTPCLRARRATRAGSTPPPGFFDETSMSRRKTTCIHARSPLRGSYPSAPSLRKGTRKSEAKKRKQIIGNSRCVCHTTAASDHGCTHSCRNAAIGSSLAAWRAG